MNVFAYIYRYRMKECAHANVIHMTGCKYLPTLVSLHPKLRCKLHSKNEMTLAKFSMGRRDKQLNT